MFSLLYVFFIDLFNVILIHNNNNIINSKPTKLILEKKLPIHKI